MPTGKQYFLAACQPCVYFDRLADFQILDDAGRQEYIPGESGIQYDFNRLELPAAVQHFDGYPGLPTLIYFSSDHWINRMLPLRS